MVQWRFTLESNVSHFTESLFNSVLNWKIQVMPNSHSFSNFMWNQAKSCQYSVSSLETTIFREIISLVRVIFRSTFLSSWLTPYFDTLMGGNTHPLLPPIRVSKYGVKWELRKVDLKLTLTNEIISRKIVVFRVEALYKPKQNLASLFVSLTCFPNLNYRYHYHMDLLYTDY